VGVALGQYDTRPGSGSRDRRAQSGRAAADDQHVGFGDDGRLARGFLDHPD
jgi:hypothetical protein